MRTENLWLTAKGWLVIVSATTFATGDGAWTAAINRQRPASSSASSRRVKSRMRTILPSRISITWKSPSASGGKKGGNSSRSGIRTNLSPLPMNSGIRTGTPASRASRMVFMTSSRVWQLPSSSHARHSTSGSSISRKTLRSPRSTRASYASRKRSLFALDIRTFSRSPFPGSNRAGSRWTFISTECVAERGRLSQGKEVGDR